MLKSIKYSAAVAAVTLLLGGTVSASAASFTTASKTEQKDQTEKVFTYAKNDLLKKNQDLAKDMDSGKTTKAKLFDKKAYPGVGASDGYQDLLVGLKRQGYKFTGHDKQLVKKNLIVSKKSTPKQLANAIIGLQAVGFNPKAYKTNGEKLNLVKMLYQNKKVLNKKTTTNEQAQVLVALKSNKKFKAPKKAKFTVKKLSNKLAKKQIKVTNHKSKNYKNDGGWAYNDDAASVDADTTAMTLNALEMSKSKNKTVKKSITKGRHYLKVNVNKDGGFGMDGKSNANSNAEVITALSMNKKSFKKINQVKLNDKQENSTLKNTLSFVKEDGSIKDAYDQTMGVGQALVALSAYHNGKYANNGVYQFK